MLDYSWSRTKGFFVGAVTDEWLCPGWVGDLCQHAVQVVAGSTTYFPEGGSPFVWPEDLILTDGDGVAPLYMYISVGATTHACSLSLVRNLRASSGQRSAVLLSVPS